MSIKKILLSFILFILNTHPTLAASPIIIDHNSVVQFDQIPDSYVQATANLRVMVRRASVGGNISDGLTALQTTNSKYNRSRWDWQDRGNPGWIAKVDDLISQTISQQNNFDVFTMKFCFIDNDSNYSSQWDYYRTKMLQLENSYPAKKFIWWTMPLTDSPDDWTNDQRSGFNNLVRAYATASGKILFDIAAIESHDLYGNIITTTTAPPVERLFTSYTSDGGHLSTIGAERVAKAWWVLIAKTAGWSSSTGPTPGDLNSDGHVDVLDLRSAIANFTDIFTLNTVISNFGK